MHSLALPPFALQRPSYSLHRGLLVAESPHEALYQANFAADGITFLAHHRRKLLPCNFLGLVQRDDKRCQAHGVLMTFDGDVKKGAGSGRSTREKQSE